MSARSNSSRRPLPRIPHQQRLSLPLPSKSIALLRTTSLHLYRGLLREASYLYDDVSRAYVTQYIRQRFRRSKEEDKPFRYMGHIKTAKYGLNTLARANAGDIDRLYKVLQLGWGRIGPRRHWAWDRLMEYPTTEPRKPLIPGVARTIPPPTKTNPALRAVLEAWTKAPLKIRRLEPQIPEESILQRPLSKRRTNNILWRNHTTLLDKTFPPISRFAFTLLEDLAAGRATEVGPKRGERKNIEGIVQGIRELPESADVHVVNRRLKRRLYEKLVQECCWLAWDPDTNTWKAGRKINGLRPKAVGWDGFFGDVDAEEKEEFTEKKWDKKNAEWDEWLGEEVVPKRKISISLDEQIQEQSYGQYKPEEKQQAKQPRVQQSQQYSDNRQQQQPRIQQSQQYSESRSQQSQQFRPQQQQSRQKSHSQQPQLSRQQDRGARSDQRSQQKNPATQTPPAKPGYVGMISRGKAAERRGQDRGE